MEPAFQKSYLVELFLFKLDKYIAGRKLGNLGLCWPWADVV